MMGTTDRWENEQPVHEVRISKSYYMGKYEVTQAEWVKVMGSNPSRWTGDTLPVECVSWNDVIDYCNKRSAAEGLKPCYSGTSDTISCDFSANGYRLPTEAEWAALGMARWIMSTAGVMTRIRWLGMMRTVDGRRIQSVKSKRTALEYMT